MTSRSSTSTAAAVAAPTPREQALLKEIEALKKQLAQQKPTAPVVTPPVLNRAAAEAALIDFLSDPASMAAEIERLLVHFPVTSSSARVFYETLLDDVKPSTLPSAIAKIRALQRHQILCPREVWRAQRKLEALEVSVSELGEWGTARLLVALYQATDAPRPSCDDLYSKLDRSDQLLLVYALHEYGLPLGLSPRLAKQIPLVHYARHGPTPELNEQIKSLQPSLGATHVFLLFPGGMQMTTHAYQSRHQTTILPCHTKETTLTLLSLDPTHPHDTYGMYLTPAAHIACHTHTTALTMTTKVGSIEGKSTMRPAVAVLVEQERIKKNNSCNV